ncbi:thioredoxin family protein [Sinomicrobium sp. M5D2P9]
MVRDLEHSHFLVFMGTWCHDTKMFLPKFLKLMDSLEISKDRTTLYNVDKKKRHPRAPIKKYGIKYVPTVIFIKDGEEVGRIVEFPFYSIEEDISKMYANLDKDTKE